MAVYYNDADPAACAWLRELIAAGLLPAGEVDERSILEVEPADLRGFAQCHFFAGIGGWPYALRLAGVAEDLSVWTGSPPCQPFSQAGQRKGQDDDRHLAPAFLRLVAACRPGARLRRAGRERGSARTRWRQRLESRLRVQLAGRGSTLWRLTLEAASYAVAAADLPAAGIGAPHIRQRLFFGAVALEPQAGWATASARDHKDGSECRAVPINALLGRQVWLAGWPTPMANDATGSPIATADGDRTVCARNT